MRASISAHSSEKRNTSRATTQALVTSITDAPVSSVIRLSNEMPERFTIWLPTLVAMISRRRGWALIAAS